MEMSIRKWSRDTGIFVTTLRYDGKNKRSPNILFEFGADASYPFHNCPAREELFVLEGSAIFGGAILTKGGCLYTSADSKHKFTSKGSCVLLFIVPEEVKIL